MTVPVADHQQGVPVRPGRDRAGRPADPGGRVRRRGGRRHGVDDQGAAPAARRAGPGYKYGSVELRRLDGARRPDRRVRPHLDGRVHRAAQPPARDQPGGAGRVRRPVASAGRRRRSRTGCWPRRSSPSRCRSGAATRSCCSTPTRACGRTPPPRRWPGCGPRSAKDGTITAGSASQISDGAAAVVVMSAEAAAAAGATGAGRGRRARRGGRAGHLAALPAVARDQRGARQGRAGRRPTWT